MNAILSLGSINADFQMRVEDWPQGAGTVLTRDLLRASGGKAANVAVLARRLGAESRLLGCVDDDDLAEFALAGQGRGRQASTSRSWSVRPVLPASLRSSSRLVARR